MGGVHISPLPDCGHCGTLNVDEGSILNGYPINAPCDLIQCLILSCTGLRLIGTIRKYLLMLTRGKNVSNPQLCFEACSFFHTKFVSGKGLVVGWDAAAEEEVDEGTRGGGLF